MSNQQVTVNVRVRRHNPAVDGAKGFGFLILFGLVGGAIGVVWVYWYIVLPIVAVLIAIYLWCRWSDARDARRAAARRDLEVAEAVTAPIAIPHDALPTGRHAID